MRFTVYTIDGGDIVCDDPDLTFPELRKRLTDNNTDGWLSVRYADRSYTNRILIQINHIAKIVEMKG